MNKLNAVILGVIASIGIGKAQAYMYFRTLPNVLKFKAIEAQKERRRQKVIR